MKVHTVPIIKIGTPYQRPSWRYDALINPQKYGLTGFSSRISPDSGFMKRLYDRELTVAHTYKIPDYFVQLSKKLPLNLQRQLEKVWNKHYFKSHRRKIEFSPTAHLAVPCSWHAEKIHLIRDSYLQKLVLNFFNLRYHDDIDYAVRFWKSTENSEIKRYLGYSFYAQLEDKTIAKRWHITVPRVIAIRLLFFDFSHFPKDRIASWAMMRQLAELGEIDTEDFARYKKIYDLGELGMKVIEDYHHLTKEEKSKVEVFLGESAVVNTLHLNLGIRNTKDALNYNSVVSNFSKLGILREEMKQREATIRLTELHISKATKELGNVENTVHDDDLELLSAMREISKRDIEPKFTTFAELLSIK